MKKEEGTGEARLFVQVPAAAKGELNQKGRHASETKAWGSGKPQNLSRERRGTVCLSIQRVVVSSRTTIATNPL